MGDAQLDTSHHLPPCCIPEIWVHGESPVWPPPKVGTAWFLLESPVQAVQAYWGWSAELVGEHQGRVSRRGRRCSMVQMCWCGQEVGEPGTLEFSKDKVPGQQERGKG